MCRRLSLCILLVCVLVGTLLNPRVAAAGRWGKGNEYYFRADRICRDGMVVTVALLGGDSDQTEVIFSIEARLYTNSGLKIPTDRDTFFDPPVEAYGPMLVGPTLITATLQSTELVTDTNDDAIVDENDNTFKIYKIGEVIPWAQVLPIGRTVLVSGGAGTLPAEVEDCYINRKTVSEGGTLTLDAQALRFRDNMTDAASLIYRLDVPPAAGVLKLKVGNAFTALAAGATFTQEDIDKGRLRYDHAGGEGSDDVFTYTLRGISRVSTSASGVQGNNSSTRPTLFDDGSRVAFQSTASNLVQGDTNGVSDIFLHDLSANRTARMSVNDNGAQANGASFNPAISGYGTVVYASDASNLVSGDTSADCRKRLDTNGVRDVFKSSHSNSSFSTERISISSDSASCIEGNGPSDNPTGNSNSKEAFYSSATNLTASDSNGTIGDILWFNNTFSRFELASLSSAGSQLNLPSQEPEIADSSDWVAFSSDGALVGDDGNGQRDVYVRSLKGSDDTTVLVSRDNDDGAAPTGGASSNPSISADGRYVAFHSTATSLVGGDTNSKQDVFLRDRGVGDFDVAGAVTTTLISVDRNGGPANDDSYNPAVAAWGRYVVFTSDASDLIAGDSNSRRDVFVRDLLTGRTTRVSLAANGGQANGQSRNAIISTDGSYVAFESDASNLVPNDTNGKTDIFVAFTGFTSPFPISISAVNDPPSITSITPQTLQRDATLGPLRFIVSDPDGPLPIKVTASSSNQELIPDVNITLGGSSANRTLTLTPAPGATGQLTITVLADDGVEASSMSFPLTLLASQENTPPTITAIDPQQVAPGVTLGPLAFTIADRETSPLSLTVTASSSNQLLVPDANIILGGSGASRTLTLTPTVGAVGQATISLQVGDGEATASSSFTLTVQAAAANSPPTVTPITAQRSLNGGAIGPLDLTIGDVETNPNDLSVTAHSSDQSLVPDAGLVLGGSGANRTLMITPAAGVIGQTTIIIEVSDGGATTTTSFTLVLGERVNMSLILSQENIVS